MSTGELGGKEDPDPSSKKTPQVQKAQRDQESNTIRMMKSDE